MSYITLSTGEVLQSEWDAKHVVASIVNGERDGKTWMPLNDGSYYRIGHIVSVTDERADLDFGDVFDTMFGCKGSDAAMAKLHDQMNAAMLKYEMAQGIEKRDGDGAIVVPWVLKMHALLEEAATLGSCNCTNDCTNSERTNGTCHADETDTWECVCDQIGRYGKRVTVHVMECSECGHTYEHVNGDYEYCPHCGRRVVEVNA